MARKDEGEEAASVPALVGQRLTLEAFSQLAGTLAGYPFIKVVVDRPQATIHFINNDRYEFHANYIAENILGMTAAQLEAELDRFNESVYLDPERRFYLGILTLHKRGAGRFFSLETVEIDNMDADKVKSFFRFVKDWIDPALPLLWKPANHLQETIVNSIGHAELPRVFTHELFSSAPFVALSPGAARGRIRAFRTTADYRAAFDTIAWHDIVVMDRVPDDIPRVSGIINAQHTTPLSHTNILASGWQIPNAVQIGIFEQIEQGALDGECVRYSVDPNAAQIGLERIAKPDEALQRPAWSAQQVTIEQPDIVRVAIAPLDKLRMSDRYRYGTKAANLGELRNLLSEGSERVLGFYKVRRPPRSNLLPHLAKQLGVPNNANLGRAAIDFLRSMVTVPRGIAIPFSLQQEFLESAPRMQQAIGKLKMALELNAREADALCLNLQQLIRKTRMPDRVRDYIDREIAKHLAGSSSFVIRSSSNAEDLENFSAAGIYESINHVTTAANVFESVKEVWASLLSPRSVRLRQQVGISLDDCYMGVIIQEEVHGDMGGVLVTTNPMARGSDFRNVYINVSRGSVNRVVQGSEAPLQYLFNTVEGGGRTVSLGDAKTDLEDDHKAILQKLALVGRLLQSHFSPDYTFESPVDVEWIASLEGLFILQLRPYAK